MNITNKGKKIVNIGELALLPGMTAPLPESYEGNPVVGFLIERGTLSCDQPFCSAAPKAPLIDDASDGADEGAATTSIEEQVKAIGSTAFTTADEETGKPGDWLYYQGRWYECKSCQLWDHTILSHYESEFTEVPPGPTATKPEVEVSG